MIKTTPYQQAIILAMAERLMNGLVYNKELELYEISEKYVLTVDKQLYQQIAPLFDMVIPHLKKEQ